VFSKRSVAKPKKSSSPCNTSDSNGSMLLPSLFDKDITSGTILIALYSCLLDSVWNRLVSSFPFKSTCRKSKKLHFRQQHQSTMNASAIASKISAAVVRPAGSRSMSSTANVWVDKNTRVICQGFTGKQVCVKFVAWMIRVWLMNEWRHHACSSLHPHCHFSQFCSLSSFIFS
jgi:succinyl-CoA synthetase alpha subunit